MRTATASETKRGTGRPPFRRAIFAMALPPTGDDPQEFALWRQGVGLMIRAASQTPIPGQVSLILRAAWSEQARDLTITARRIIDALAECGVIEHAAQVMRLRSEWT